ncbi:MAG: redox-sensing transcriptional repressor Rex [Chitinivibrionales bacterium]|nr:redox-sensing transcriptional repressor Rex [Chitinivibrionales bacterium]
MVPRDMKDIPIPTLERLCRIYGICLALEREKTDRISSARLAQRLGVSAHVVRKDLSHLGAVGVIGAGYGVTELRQALATGLGLERALTACVVGLGRLGSALLEHKGLAEAGARIVAGFDANINRLETIRTTVAVYPAYEIEDIVRRERIALGIIAVPAGAAQAVANRLIAGGVQCILNFAPVVVRDPHGRVPVRTVDVTNEIRVLSALTGGMSQKAEGDSDIRSQ